ncbi:protein Tube-like [Lytechinus variegatus]|uniref:protein Tube-like n=1 Tax=Lytechinus variegatus TaxID=7654 RepID=UPI001BB1E097|nr:protein Tube-like [Lytechinus variegatus]
MISRSKSIMLLTWFLFTVYSSEIQARSVPHSAKDSAQALTNPDPESPTSMPDVAGSSSKEIPHDTDDDVNIESAYHYDDGNNAESAYYSNSADNQNSGVYESVIYNDEVLDDDDDDEKDDDDGESVLHQQSENTGK